MLPGQQCSKHFHVVLSIVILGIWHFCARLCYVAAANSSCSQGPISHWWDTRSQKAPWTPFHLNWNGLSQKPGWPWPLAHHAPAAGRGRAAVKGLKWGAKLCPPALPCTARQGWAPTGSVWGWAGGVNEPGCAMCAALLEFCSETPWETQSMYYLRWLLEADANVSLLRSPKYPVLLWCVACVCSMYVSISHANKRLLSPFVLCSLIMRTLQPLSVGLPLQMLTVELR